MKLLLCSCPAALIATGVAADVSTPASSGQPTGLSAYGQIVWNLDALVLDYYGGARTCLRQRGLSLHRCNLPQYNDGDYSITFAKAHNSSYRVVARSSNPLRSANVIPIKFGRKYISCGTDRWLGITNAPRGWGEAVACVQP